MTVCLFKKNGFVKSRESILAAVILSAPAARSGPALLHVLSNAAFVCVCVCVRVCERDNEREREREREEKTSREIE